LIGDVSGPSAGGWTILTNNSGGRPFNGAGNMPPRGEGGGPLGGGDNGFSRDQNPRSYVTGLA